MVGIGKAEPDEAASTLRQTAGDGHGAAPVHAIRRKRRSFRCLDKTLHGRGTAGLSLRTLSSGTRFPRTIVYWNAWSTIRGGAVSLAIEQ